MDGYGAMTGNKCGLRGVCIKENLQGKNIYDETHPISCFIFMYNNSNQKVLQSLLHNFHYAALSTLIKELRYTELCKLLTECINFDIWNQFRHTWSTERTINPATTEDYRITIQGSGWNLIPIQSHWKRHRRTKIEQYWKEMTGISNTFALIVGLGNVYVLCNQWHTCLLRY